MAMVDSPTTRQGWRVGQLDGVRALAAFAVFWFHARMPGGRAGFIGVDVFFVLSGFLISSLLLDEVRRTGSIRIRAFWWRRFRRLVPALLLVVAVSVPLYGLLHLAYPSAASTIPLRTVVPSLLYYMSWYRPQCSPCGNLEHTWSLAVEVHFYMLWPLALLAAFRWRLRPLAVAATLLALVVAWRIYLQSSGTPTAYLYSASEVRFDQLLVGCCLAAGFDWLKRLDWLARSAGAWLATAGGAGLVAITALLPWPEYFIPGVTLLIATLAAAVIVPMAAGARGPVGWLLGSGPLVWMGERSYGFYLWHYPVLGLLLHYVVGPRRTLLVLLGFGVTLGLAAASYALLERPIMALPRGRIAHARVAPAGSSAAAWSSGAPG